MEVKIGDGRRDLYQWDTGQFLIIEGPEEIQEVHFCYSTDEVALICKARQVNAHYVVDVPNILLQDAGLLHVYLYYRGEDGTVTREAKTVTVTARPRPADYVYTETEVWHYIDLENRVNQLEAGGIAEAVNAYLQENPVEAGATKEEAAQIQKNREEIEKVSAEISAWEDTPAIICAESGDVIAVRDSGDRPLRGLTIYGKTTQFTTTGKNLVDVKPFTLTMGDGRTKLIQLDKFIPAGVYTIQFVVSDAVLNGQNVGLEVLFESSETQKFSTFNTGLFSASFNATSKINRLYFFIGSGAGENATATISNIQIEVGDTATEYEPYGGGIVSPSPDYPSELVNAGASGTINVTVTDGAEANVQTLTASTPNGLPGIPVSGGGNYTDENGQQWVCDEIDFANGVYVQRIGIIASYAGEAINGVYMSTTGEMTVGATVIYILAEPIETPLPVEELEAYAVLHTNKPNTTVYNDAGAGIGLAYVADTKNYIDQKLAAISAAVLNA